jgi:hypothetical protein
MKNYRKIIILSLTIAMGLVAGFFAVNPVNKVAADTTSETEVNNDINTTIINCLCTPTPTQTPDPTCTPTSEPSLTPTPEITITPDPTVTPTPTQKPSNNGGSTSGDGRSDGLGCGSHDCSGNAVSSEQVLGVSTMILPATGFGPVK